MMRKTCFVFGVALMVLLATTPAFADATVWLDAYDNANTGVAGPVWTSGVLEAGQKYRITIQGTYSLYSPWYWTDYSYCGTPDPAPIYPSPAVVPNGKVGGDPAYWFAALAVEPACPWVAQGPQSHSLVEFNLDGNPLNWVYLTPRETVFQANHTYTYEIIGQGTPAGFQFRDFPTADDYGMFRIQVEKVVRIFIPLLMKNP